MPCSTNTIVQYLDKKLSLPTHKTVQRVQFEMLDELWDSLRSIWMWSYLNSNISHVLSISMKAWDNPHLQVLTKLLFQSSEDLMSQSKAEEIPGLLSFLAHFSDLPSQFSCLHSKSACALLLTPAAPKKKKKRWFASLTEASHWLFQLIVSRTLSGPSS